MPICCRMRRVLFVLKTLVNLNGCMSFISFFFSTLQCSVMCLHPPVFLLWSKASWDVSWEWQWVKCCGQSSDLLLWLWSGWDGGESLPMAPSSGPEMDTVNRKGLNRQPAFQFDVDLNSWRHIWQVWLCCYYTGPYMKVYLNDWLLVAPYPKGIVHK